MIDFYELLGINKNSTKDEIKQAYKKMVKKYHPDVNSSKEANKIIRSLNEAKEILLDTDKREEYDKLLDEIKHSKQFSKDKEETYNVKKNEYKETYSDVYVTKWQYFVNYIFNAIDNILIKILKAILIIINFSIFTIIKGIVFGVIFILFLISGFIDYFAGLIMFLAVLSLFVLAGNKYPDYIPFIPANVENFCLLSIVAMIIEVLKETVLNGTVNLVAILGDVEETIFIAILMK